MYTTCNNNAVSTFMYTIYDPDPSPRLDLFSNYI